MKKELEQRFFNKVADRLSFSFDFSEISVRFILFKILKKKSDFQEKIACEEPSP